MKIGILTLYYKNYNYGAQLQSYALVKKLQEMGFDAEQIAYNHHFRSKIYFQFFNALKSSGSNKIEGYRCCLKSIAKYIAMPITSFRILFRKSKLYSFITFIPHSKEKYNKRNISDSCTNYDKFICGSDIVWTMNSDPSKSALGFVPKGKKISYAASIGTNTIPEGWAEKFLPAITELDSISVREKSIASELSNYLPNKDVSVVVDPVLLFDSNEWIRMIENDKKKKISKYGLCYILSEDQTQMHISEEYISRLEIEVLSFPNIQNIISRWQKDFGDIKNYSASPFDFVRLILNADVVITDSFHVVVFSVLFHKPFYALKRDSEKQFVGRVEDFLETVGLQKQMITVDELTNIITIPNISFESADKIIQARKDFSIKYLKDNLN